MKIFSGYRARQTNLCSDSEKVQHAGGMDIVVSIETPELEDSQSLQKIPSPSPILHRSIYGDSRILSASSRVLRTPGRRSVDHPGFGGIVGLAYAAAPSNLYKDTRGIAPSFLTRLTVAKDQPGSSHPSSSMPESSRASNATSSVTADHILWRSPSRPSMMTPKDRFVVDEIGRSIDGRRKEGQNLVVVGFDANVRLSSNSAILWVLHNVVKKGDKLALVGVLDWVRGPLGYKCQVHDQSFLSANQKLLQAELRLKKDAWRKIPGLATTCEQAEVKLLVDVKAAHRPEVAIVEEALALDASHVVLDKSLKNRRRRYYLENLACIVIRMRRSGGVDTIRSSENPRNEYFQRTRDAKFLTTNLLSPTSVLRSATGKFVNSQGTISFGTATTSSSNRSHDTIDSEISSDLFSICHYGGSTRDNSNLVDSGFIQDLEQQHCSVSGYESDDLFSIGGSASARESFALSGPVDVQSIRTSLAVSNDFAILNTHSRPSSITADHRRLDKHLETVKSFHDSIVNARNSSDQATLITWESEPLVESTVSRITFVVGLGDVVDVNLCNELQPGEALLVGSSPSALFLVHTDQNHHNIRGVFPYTMSAGPPNAFIAVEGRMAIRLADLESDQRVLAVDAGGHTRTVSVAHTTIQPKPLVLVEAVDGGDHWRHGVLLHHAGSMCLVTPGSVPVSVHDLKLGDKVMIQPQAATQPATRASIGLT